MRRNMPFKVRQLVRSPYLWLLAVFAISRVIYYAAGVRFDARPLDNFFQFLDPALLENRLLESLWYMHTQPPGFNLFAGLVLKLFPSAYASAFSVLYMIMGACIAILIFSLMLLFNCNRHVAWIITALFIVSPGFVLFENILVYEYPLMAVGCLAAWLLYRLLLQPGWLNAALFFGCIAALAWIRSIYHFLYYLLIFAAVLILIKVRRTQITVVGFIGLLLVLVPYIKNWYLYGVFNSSTWMSYNMATITVGHLTQEEKDRFVKEGLISPVCVIPAPSPIDAYRNYIHPVPLTGIPVLDQETDSTGRSNFNNLQYFQVQKYYVTDGKALLRHYPKCYVRSLEKSWFTYFLPSGDFPFFDLNRPKIFTWDRVWNVLFFGQWRDASNRKNLRALEASGSPLMLVLFTGTYLLLGLPLLCMWGCWLLWTSIRNRGLEAARAATLAFMLFNIAYVTGVCNFLSSFENNRYRLPVDGFYAILLAMAVSRIMAARFSLSQLFVFTPKPAWSGVATRLQASDRQVNPSCDPAAIPDSAIGA